MSTVLSALFLRLALKVIFLYTFLSLSAFFFVFIILVFFSLFLLLGGGGIGWRLLYNDVAAGLVPFRLCSFFIIIFFILSLLK